MEKQNKVIEGLKSSLLAIFPFVAAGILQKNKSGVTWKGVLMGVLSGILWFMIVTNSTNDPNITELQKQLESSNDQIFTMSQTLEAKEGDIDRLTDQLEELQPETMAEIALPKLKNDNMVDEPAEIAIDIIYEIEPSVKAGIPESAGIFGGYKQIFTFSDGSKIKIYKNDDNIFLPYNTEIIN